ncbi:phytanoyl-CoA dioxygenase family protein [Marinomonas gallaica]|uniref:hypothetical protein n=1 Tax=Marinomonas gallaica TaxID=1806667 RepID=UPI00082DDF16|nr:hypothetical protein [Marinomonas gallaica]
MKKIMEIKENEFSINHIKNLSEGTLIIIRNSPTPHKLRNELKKKNKNLNDFYLKKKKPSTKDIKKLTNRIKSLRDNYKIPYLFKEIIEKIHFKPIKIDNGISRLVFDSKTLSDIEKCDFFEREDFKRRSPDSNTETFMPGSANIHRDFNRPHDHLQINFWFPMHDTSDEEVLRIWPDLYKENILDMPNSEENIHSLGVPAQYQLNFGDIIVFHSEHIHTSPKRTSETTRHTYELRVAYDCHDDNNHYRSNFTDFKNIKNEKNRTQISKIKKGLNPSKKKSKKETFSEEIFLSRSKVKKPSRANIKDFISRTNSPYFLMRMVEEVKPKKDLIELAIKKAEKEKNKIPKEKYLPVTYKNLRTQIKPSESIERMKRDKT